jgi:hypothetical protein
MRKDGRIRRRDDVTFIGETDTKIMVRWNRPHNRDIPRFAYRNGKVVQIDPVTGQLWRKGRTHGRAGDTVGCKAAKALIAGAMKRHDP